MRRNEPITKIATQAVQTVHVAQKLSEVRKMISEMHIHHIPVVSGSQLVGIISSSDMLRLSMSVFGAADERAVDAILDHQFTIEQVMRKEVTTIRDTATVRDAAQALADGAIHSLPVVDADRNLKGIVTSTDLIRYLLELY